MSDRFYVPARLDQPSIDLPPGEAHHALRVLRKQIGDRVSLFDGRGDEAVGVITEVGRKSVRVKIVEMMRQESPPEPSISLGVALPKGDRARWLVEKATEIGVGSLIPLVTERSVVPPRPTRLEKLRQTVVSACKQSGRNQLMDIERPLAWEEWLDRESSAGIVVIADPGGRPFVEVFSRIAPNAVQQASKTLAVAVGPEGGFTPDEIDAARRAGAEIVSLGHRTLRVETAAVVLAGLLTFGQWELRTQLT